MDSLFGSADKSEIKLLRFLTTADSLYFSEKGLANLIKVYGLPESRVKELIEQAKPLQQENFLNKQAKRRTNKAGKYSKHVRYSR